MMVIWAFNLDYDDRFIVGGIVYVVEGIDNFSSDSIIIHARNSDEDEKVFQFGPFDSVRIAE